MRGNLRGWTVLFALGIANLAGCSSKSDDSGLDDSLGGGYVTPNTGGGGAANAATGGRAVATGGRKATGGSTATGGQSVIVNCPDGEQGCSCTNNGSARCNGTLTCNPVTNVCCANGSCVRPASGTGGTAGTGGNKSTAGAGGAAGSTNTSAGGNQAGASANGGDTSVAGASSNGGDTSVAGGTSSGTAGTAAVGGTTAVVSAATGGALPTGGNNASGGQTFIGDCPAGEQGCSCTNDVNARCQAGLTCDTVTNVCCANGSCARPPTGTGGNSGIGGDRSAGGTGAPGGGSSLPNCLATVLTTPNGVVSCTSPCSLKATLTGGVSVTYDCDCVSSFMDCTAGSTLVPACPAAVVAGSAPCDSSKDNSCSLLTTTSVATITYSCSCASGNSQWACSTS